jgi:hypothetical protein
MGVGSITCQRMLKGSREVPPELEAWLRWIGKIAAIIKANPAPDYERQTNHPPKGRATGGGSAGLPRHCRAAFKWFLLNLRGSSSICVVALAVSRTAEDHLS